jgi:hypothetical protein
VVEPFDERGDVAAILLHFGDAACSSVALTIDVVKRIMLADRMCSPTATRILADAASFDEAMVLLEASSDYGGIIWTEVQKYGSELWRQFAYLTHGGNAMNGAAMKMNWAEFHHAGTGIHESITGGSFVSMSVDTFAVYLRPVFGYAWNAKDQTGYGVPHVYRLLQRLLGIVASSRDFYHMGFGADDKGFTVLQGFAINNVDEFNTFMGREVGERGGKFKTVDNAEELSYYLCMMSWRKYLVDRLQEVHGLKRREIVVRSS